MGKNKGILEKILFAVSIFTACVLIASAFIVDWIGLSKPGFGLKQRFVMTVGLWILGFSLLLKSRVLNRKIIPETRILLQQVIRENLFDIWLFLILFGIADIIGTLYVFFVKSNNIGLFYAATTGSSIPLRSFWNPLNPYGILFGLVIGLVYLVFRLGMGRLLSFIFAIAFMVSSNHLHNLIPSIFRDYAKAPFILSVVLIIGLMVKLPLNKTRLFFLSIIGGIIIGFGYWIRQDLIVFIPPVIISLLFFLPVRLFADIKIKLMSVGLFITFFLLLALPKLDQSVSSGSYRTVGGFMSPLNARLGVSNPPYDWGYIFSDEFIWADSYANAKADNPDYSYAYTGTEYGRIGSGFIKKIAVNFPADILIRAYGSVLKVLELPFTYVEAPIGLHNSFIQKTYSQRELLLNFLHGWGLFLAIVALLIVSVHSFRQSMFCLLILFYLGGYPMLQFQGRHYFHLEFISLWFLGFIIQSCVTFVRHKILKRSAGSRLSMSFILYRTLLFSAVSSGIVLIPYFTLGQYQKFKVSKLFEAYYNADIEQVPLSRVMLANNTVLLTNPQLFKPPVIDSVSSNLLVADFCAKGCGDETVMPVLRYERYPFSGRPDFSRSMSINLDNQGNGSKRLYFPAIASKEESLGSNYFKGIELSREQVSCLRGLYRVKDTRKLEILSTVILAESRNYDEFRQTLTAWKKDRIYTIPENLPPKLANELLTHSFISLAPDDISFCAENVHFASGKCIIKGYAQPQKDPYNYPLSGRSESSISNILFADISIAVVDSDLLKTKNVLLKKGDFFVAQGELFSGGLTFGLIRNNQSAGSVRITDQGKFTVLLKVPADGLYSLGLANYLDGYTSLENRIKINKSGWITKI